MAPMRLAASSRCSPSARGGSTFTPNFSAGFGTYDTGAGECGICRNDDSLRYSLQVGGRTSDGFNAITNPDNFSYNPDRDGFNTKNLSANLGWTWAAGQELSAQYFGNRLNAQSDGGAPYFDDRTITTVQAWSANSRNKVNDSLDVAADRGRRQRQVRVGD
jgi:vitamin B12 transporter